MKLYDKVKTLLEMYPKLRNSDMELFWDICERKQLTREGFISKSNFMNAPAFESISRARRKVQENHPELAASESVKIGRDIKESKKGYFPYHEQY